MTNENPALEIATYPLQNHLCCTYNSMHRLTKAYGRQWIPASCQCCKLSCVRIEKWNQPSKQQPFCKIRITQMENSSRVYHSRSFLPIGKVTNLCNKLDFWPMQASQTLIPDHRCPSCFSNRSQEWLNIESVHEKLRTEIGGLRSKVQWLQQGLTHATKLALTILRYFSNLFWENSLTRMDCKYGRVKTNGDVPLCDKARSSQQQRLSDPDKCTVESSHVLMPSPWAEWIRQSSTAQE